MHISDCSSYVCSSDLDPGRPAPGRRRAGAVGDAVDAPPPARTAVSTEAPLAIPEEPLAVSVLTGFLGSGKTTLLRHLLAHPAMEETAVIVNEFGEIGLDHLLVQQAAEEDRKSTRLNSSH